MITIIITAIMTTVIVTAFWLHIMQHIKKTIADGNKTEVYIDDTEANEWYF